MRKVATEVAARHADDVDAQARFPRESIAALRELKVLSAAVPVSLGGFGCSMVQQGQLCAAMAQGCSASGMVLAMHLIEVACIARHGMESPYFIDVMKRIVSEQTLIASVTSEVGTSGDTRSSICAVERDGDRFTLEKAATTVSYGQHADALLVTARRAPDAAAGDQVLVYLEKGDYTLTPDLELGHAGHARHLQPGRPVERASAGRAHRAGQLRRFLRADDGALLAHPVVRACGGASPPTRSRARPLSSAPPRAATPA